MRKGDIIITPGGVRRRVRRIQPIRGGLKVWYTVIDKTERQAIPPELRWVRIRVGVALIDLGARILPDVGR